MLRCTRRMRQWSRHRWFLLRQFSRIVCNQRSLNLNTLQKYAEVIWKDTTCWPCMCVRGRHYCSWVHALTWSTGANLQRSMRNGNNVVGVAMRKCSRLSKIWGQKRALVASGGMAISATDMPTVTFKCAEHWAEKAVVHCQALLYPVHWLSTFEQFWYMFWIWVITACLPSFQVRQHRFEAIGEGDWLMMLPHEDPSRGCCNWSKLREQHWHSRGRLGWPSNRLGSSERIDIWHRHHCWVLSRPSGPSKYALISIA